MLPAQSAAAAAVAAEAAAAIDAPLPDKLLRPAECGDSSRWDRLCGECRPDALLDLGERGACSAAGPCGDVEGDAWYGGEPADAASGPPMSEESCARLGTELGGRALGGTRPWGSHGRVTGGEVLATRLGDCGCLKWGSEKADVCEGGGMLAPGGLLLRGSASGAVRMGENVWLGETIGMPS